MRCSSPLPKGWRLLPILLILPMVAACATGQKAVSPPVAIPEAFSRSGGAPLPDEWWRVLGDRHLDRLIDEALSGNLSLKEAFDRLERARALARKSGAGVYPGLEATAKAARTARKPLESSRTEREGTTNSFSLGLAASYELDLWGRVRSGREAARLDALAAEQDVRAAAISLTAEVATVWYRLLEQRRQIELIDSQIKTDEEYLDLTILRFKKGQASATDILQQRQSLEAAKGEKIAAEASAKLLEHQLAILLGKAPGTTVIPGGAEFPLLPPLPDVGLPSELIQKRPDVRSAYLKVRAADRRVAAAIAERFPKISISANAETSGAEVRDLFQNWIATLAANLVAPLFDGGRRAAGVDQSKAEAEAALHAYGRTILSALKEVEDALVREAQQKKLVENLEKQLALSRASIKQIRDRYVHGDASFLRLLTGLIGHQNLERSLLRARRGLVECRIDLCRALAGGWQVEKASGALQAREDRDRGR